MKPILLFTFLALTFPSFPQISPDSISRYFKEYEDAGPKDAMNIISDKKNKNHPSFPIQCDFLNEDFEYQFRTEIMASTLSTCFRECRHTTKRGHL